MAGLSLFVDSGVFIALQNKRDAQHKSAVTALRALARGAYGRGFTSDFILDEAVTGTRARTRSLADAMAVGNRILGLRGFPRILDILPVGGPVVRDALRVLMTYKEKALSFTDATTIALVKARGIDRVLSFDADFDGILERLDPRQA